jgi:hypothetical protein
MLDLVARVRGDQDHCRLRNLHDYLHYREVAGYGYSYLHEP